MITTGTNRTSTQPSLRAPAAQRFTTPGAAGALIRSLVDEGHDPADAGLAADEAPRERADATPDGAHVGQLAADVLGVDDPVREGHVVHDEQVLLGPALLDRHADLALVLGAHVGAHGPDRGVHRVVT